MKDPKHPQRNHSAAPGGTYNGTWLPSSFYASTGEFTKLGRGFVNHCGPTAITNVIMTCLSEEDTPVRRGPVIKKSRTQLADEAKNVFLDTARFGRRHLMYFNMNLFHFYGGTSDILSGPYLRIMLRKAGIRNISVSLPRPLTPGLARRALDRGSMLYVMLLHHRKYKNHHLICYSYDTDKEGQFRYQSADGWTNRPVYLEDRDLRLGFFREIKKR